MRIGIVTTTINVPTVLELYRKQQYSDFQIYVAGDLKTPPPHVSAPYVYLSPEDQKHWRCSELIGWNTDSRRNIAVLEALVNGAEIIFSIDDDMIPLTPGVLEKIDELFSRPFSGLQLGVPGEWVDHGRFMHEQASARGIPYDVVKRNGVSFVSDALIGVVQGIIYGTPDSTAVDAIAKHPVSVLAVEPLASGFVAHPEAHAVFNSQFTAFRRELAPWFVQHYQSEKRNTDIFAAHAMRNQMRELGWYTYYGPPGAWHNRAARPLVNDLKAEMFSAELIGRAYPEAFAAAWSDDIKEAME